MVCPTSWVDLPIGGNVRTQSWLGQLEEFKPGNSYCSFAYSALASFRMGMSGSASFQTASVRNGRRYALDWLLRWSHAIRATPMTTSTADPNSSPRATRFRKAWNDITAAWAKLDHAVKAIRLGFADGSRAASSRRCRLVPILINAQSQR